MEIIPTNLEGVFLIKPRIFEDSRGFFLESFSGQAFKSYGLNYTWIQDNHSMSVSRGVLRGLHFQKPPFTQAKLVRVLRGAVYDVVVDLRRDSKTYGQWQGFELSATNFLQLLIPRGLAHGFETLEDNTEFFYKVDNDYKPEFDSGIIWNDSDLDIPWPIPNPILSDKDMKLESFQKVGEFLTSFIKWN